MPSVIMEPNPIALRIGRNIRLRRKALGLSQNQLARRSPLLSGGDQVAKYERGEAVPQTKALYGLAAALGVSWQALLDPPPDEPGSELQRMLED
jgi:transcriptional regulator with XRE-family HTH domain